MRRTMIVLLSAVAMMGSARAEVDEDRGLANDISRSIEIRNTLGFSVDFTDEQLAYRQEEERRRTEDIEHAGAPCADPYMMGRSELACPTR